MICVLVYFQGLKRKPVSCKNQWRFLLHRNWVIAEIRSLDWFKFLTGKCSTLNGINKILMYKTARAKFETFFAAEKCLKMA